MWGNIIYHVHILPGHHVIYERWRFCGECQCLYHSNLKRCSNYLISWSLEIVQRQMYVKSGTLWCHRWVSSLTYVMLQIPHMYDPLQFYRNLIHGDRQFPCSCAALKMTICSLYYHWPIQWLEDSAPNLQALWTKVSLSTFPSQGFLRQTSSN
jgi:hypothetical protein